MNAVTTAAGGLGPGTSANVATALSTIRRRNTYDRRADTRRLWNATAISGVLLRYISPVLAFGTEHRYLTKEFCYRLQIEPNLLLTSKEEILILMLLRSKLIYYSRSIYS